MIPVPEGLYSKVDFSVLIDTKYRDLLEKEYRFYQKIQNGILSKASQIYIGIKKNPVLFTSYTTISPFGKMPARNIRSKHDKPAEQILAVQRVKCYIMRK